MKALTNLNRHRYLIGLSLALVLFFINSVLLSERPGIFRTLENISYDLRLQWTLPMSRDERVVIIDIDEKSLAVEGRWPWPRDRLARLVDLLFEHYAVAVLGFDMVFAEADANPGINDLAALAPATLDDPEAFLDNLARLSPLINRDRQFAQSLAGRNVVMGYYFQGHDNLNAGNRVGSLPFPALPIKEAGLGGLPFIEARGYGANLEILQNNAVAGGFFDTPGTDSDGIIRSVPLLTNFEGNLYESLALATLRVYLDRYFIEPLISTDKQGNTTGLEAIRVGELEIPVDDRGVALVPYLGPQGSFAYYSVSDILDQRIPAEKLAGRIVLLGTTSPGLQDLRNTPVQAVYPGVEVHANLIAGMLDQRVRHQPSYSIAIELLQLLAVGLILSFSLPLLSALASIMLSIFMVAMVIAYNLHAWQSGLVIPIASVLILTGLLFTLHTSYGFLMEARLKRKITRTFGQYIPPQVAEELAEQPRSLDLSGKNREMTVLFSDVRGFTSLSEGFSPSELTQVMNAILTPVTEVIYRHKGTIDKYMGDAVMAFWGAPLDDPGHATHALEAAWDMTQAITEINREFRKRGWPEIDMGIGLNSGNMNVGNMGSEYRVAYTVLGDAVNLGSRLEGLTKTYGVHIIVSESTSAKARDWVFRELDVVRVKGKEEPVAIYEPLGRADSLDPDTRQQLARYQKALSAYRQQRWREAEAGFAGLLESYGECTLYRLYQDRSKAFIQHPPGADWDGVYTFTSK